MKHVGMSQSATPAMRNKATRRLKPPKVTNLAKLAIGAAMRASRERTVAQRLANTASTPRPESETGTLATHLGKNTVLDASIPDSHTSRISIPLMVTGGGLILKLQHFPVWILRSPS
jgi:hypothetical protein